MIQCHAKLFLPGTTCNNNFRDSFDGIDSPDSYIEVTVMLIVDMKQHDDTISVITFEGLTEFIYNT